MNGPTPPDGLAMEEQVVEEYATALARIAADVEEDHGNIVPLIQAHEPGLGSGEALAQAFHDQYDGESDGVLTIAGQLVPVFGDLAEAATFSAQAYRQAELNAERGMPN
jgi:hypothetical protein